MKGQAGGCRNQRRQGKYEYEKKMLELTSIRENKSIKIAITATEELFL
ncbi:MAG TPA: hypothetical protein GX691_01615 [Clostridia bacterium]|nr:hypothetical protein [Clostridia bacterium]